MIFERTINSEDSFYEADLMISDFSGAAYEYAFGTLRPVLFIDGPRKTKNPNWRDLGLPTFEDEMREQVGEVLERGSIGNLAPTVEAMLGATGERAERLAELREQMFFNFGESSRAGAAIIAEKLVPVPA